MTEYELEVFKNMRILGHSGEELLRENPDLKERTKKQAIRRMAKMLMQAKADSEFERHFDEEYEANNEISGKKELPKDI